MLNLSREAAKSFPICSRFLKSCLAWASCSASRVPRAPLTTVSLPPVGASLEGGVAVGGVKGGMSVVVVAASVERGVATEERGVVVGVASEERGMAVGGVTGGIAITEVTAAEGKNFGGVATGEGMETE